MKYPDKLEEKTKNFPFCPENKVFSENKCNDYMKRIQPKKYAKSKKLLCDWTNKKNNLIQYRMLKIYVRHGMIVEKIHETISFKQSNWLEKPISSNIQKRKRAKK